MLTAATLSFLTVDRKASSLLVPLSLSMLAKMLHSCYIGCIVTSCLHLVNTVHVVIMTVKLWYMTLRSVTEMRVGWKHIWKSYVCQICHTRKIKFNLTAMALCWPCTVFLTLTRPTCNYKTAHFYSLSHITWMQQKLTTVRPNLSASSAPFFL